MLTTYRTFNNGTGGAQPVFQQYVRHLVKRIRPDC